MAQVYLINQTVLNEYEDISINVKPARILNIVKKAQELDLKIFLGHPMYYDFMQYITNAADGSVVFAGNTPQGYLDLFNGVTYTDRRGHTIIYEGLIPTVVYFTFARFIESDAFRYTATGPVMKHHDNADPLKVTDISKLVQMQRSIANAHCNEVEKFIWDNRSEFPLWKPNEKTKSARQPGPRIRSVDRTNFNTASGGGIGYGNGDYWGLNGLI